MLEITRENPAEPREFGNVNSELYLIGNLELEIEPANKSVKFTSDYGVTTVLPSKSRDFPLVAIPGWTGFEFIIAVRKGAFAGNAWEL